MIELPLLPVPSAIKFLKPKILLLEVAHRVANTISREGFNFAEGSFGSLYHVAKSDIYVPVIPNGYLPHGFGESDVVVVDLKPEFASAPEITAKVTSRGVTDWWAPCTTGTIDPRPRAMVLDRKYFDRILIHRGIFVIFARAATLQRFVLGYEREVFITESEPQLSAWSFLSVLDRVRSMAEKGNEITIVPQRGRLLALSEILRAHLQGATYHCVFSPSDELKGWTPLAVNKFGHTAASALETDKGGFIFLLPDLADKGSFLLASLKEVFPGLSPHLFPDAARGLWVERDEYELFSVVQLRGEIETIQDETRRKLQAIDEAIQAERARFGFLHDLLSRDRRATCRSCQKNPCIAGVRSHRDVDQKAQESASAQRREDLQLWDRSPIFWSRSKE